MQTVMSSFFAGAVITTLRAPASRCASARTASVKKPVELDDDVDTELAPRQPLWVALGEHLDDAAVDGDAVRSGSNCSGETAEDAVVLEQMREHLGSGDVVDGDDLELRGALPGRPEHVAPDAAEAVDTNSSLPCPATSSISIHSCVQRSRCHPITALARRGDQAMQPAGHGRAAAPGPLSELRQVVVRMPGAQRSGLAHGGRQRLPALRVGFEDGDRLDLPDTGRRGAAQIRRLRVEPAVDPAANLADDPPGLERETAGLRADRAQRRADCRAGSHRDHPPAAALPDLRVDSERREVSRKLHRPILAGTPELEVRLPVGPDEPAGPEERAAKTAARAAGARRPHLQ